MVKTKPTASRLVRAAWVALALATPLACTPEIVDTTSLVAGPALLAVVASPAEARPGEPLGLRALAAGRDGPAPRALDWALCTARAPLTSPGVLAPDCLGAGGDALVPLGVGVDVTTAMPANVCQTFGPDQPAPRPGQPAGRPADPDPTGGYYQPVRIVDPDAGDRRATASFEARALCHLANATPVQQAEFDRSYRLNANPIVGALALDDGTPLPSLEGDADSLTAIAAGATLGLRVSWPDCPADSDAACAGAERYTWFDPAARVFVTRRESIVVSWFATRGVFATARTGRSEAEAEVAADSANVWTAPDAATDVWLWVVLRDARGGAAWSSYRLRVE